MHYFNNQPSHLVGPLSHSYAAAGFFPKSNDPIVYQDDGEDEQEKENHDSSSKTSALDQKVDAGSNQTETVYNQTKYWLIEDSPDGRSKLNKQFLKCVQTMNLRNNFLYWDAKSKEKQQQQAKQSITSASSSFDHSIDWCTTF